MPTFLYVTRAERQAIVTVQEALGLTMQYDNHNVGPQGENEMLFEVDTRVSTPSNPRLALLTSKLSDNSASFDDLKELLRLKWGL